MNEQTKNNSVDVKTAQAPPPVAPEKASGKQATGRASKARRKKADEKLCKNIHDLTGTPKQFIDDLLTEGATFEDVVESVAEKGELRVTLQAVRNYFHSNLDLQKRRVLRQVEKAQELKKSLGDPGSAEAKLADAIFVTGYMGVTRKGAEIKLKDIESIRLSKENLRLRNSVLRLRRRKMSQDREFQRLRNDYMRKKLEKLQLNINQLKRVMASESKQNKLGPETLQKIQEIYGIVALPTIPASR